MAAAYIFANLLGLQIPVFMTGGVFTADKSSQDCVREIAIQ